MGFTRVFWRVRPRKHMCFWRVFQKHMCFSKTHVFFFLTRRKHTCFFWHMCFYTSTCFFLCVYVYVYVNIHILLFQRCLRKNNENQFKNQPTGPMPGLGRFWCNQKIKTNHVVTESNVCTCKQNNNIPKFVLHQPTGPMPGLGRFQYNQKIETKSRCNRRTSNL